MQKIDFSRVRLDLNRRIKGSVLGLGDAGFAQSISIDNGRVSLTPYLIAMPADSFDVAEIVEYCHKNHVPMTAKSGGHSAAGYCLNGEGVVLDLANLNSVDFRKSIKSQLVVGAGARWIRVYDFLRDRQSDLTVVGGGCAGVGVAGFILGGGYSFISRSNGLGCDNVVGLEFVSADGKIFELNARSKGAQKELYRALLGGGGGNFGVVTRLDLQLQKTNAPRPMMGLVTFPFYRVNEVMEFYNKWVLTLPDEMAMYGMMRTFPDPRFPGKSSVALRFTPVYNGDFAAGVDLLKPLIELNPSSVELYAMTLPEWENFVGTSTQVRGHSAYIRSLVFKRGSLNRDVVEICKKYLGRAPTDDSYIVWTHTGGKIRVENENSCYAHRASEFTFELKSEWPSASPELARTNIEWAAHFFDELGQHAEGAYLNYIDPLLMDWKQGYYRDEYEFLLKVRAHWDPSGWFNFQQCIGSDYAPAPREIPANLDPTKNDPIDISPLTRTFVQS